MSQLYVGNLNRPVSKDELNEQFSRFGRITSVDVVIDPGNHGYAIIDFGNPKGARDAIKKWDGKGIYDWKVALAVDKSDLVRKKEGAVANPGNKVFIWHTGWFKKGLEWVEFSSNKFHKKPFEFRLAASKDQATDMGWVRDEGIIEGWHQGIKGMRVGGKRILTVPPYLGFGVNERGSIPGNSWLVYEIELVDTYP